jgi:antibiotic biosynthesis monooxygenase (ABM) superfamily enzyme
MQKEALALAPVVLPLAFLLGCDLSNFLWPVPHSTLLGQLCIVALVGWQSQSILCLLFFFFIKNKTKGEDQ